MDIAAITTIADYFIIVSGNSALQIQALAAAAEETLAKNGYHLRHAEGMQTANWALQDYGDIIVHFFDKENRAFYNLERIWGDAKILDFT
jgi:ribosome-associated protein